MRKFKITLDDWNYNNQSYNHNNINIMFSSYYNFNHYNFSKVVFNFIFVLRIRSIMLKFIIGLGIIIILNLINSLLRSYLDYLDSFT